MKNKIYLQLKKLANQILANEKKLDTKSLKYLVSQLYEHLTILEYLESHIEGEPNTTDVSALDSKSYREENWFQDPKPVPQPQDSEDLAEPLIEKIKDIVAQMPKESKKVDELLEKVLPKKENMKNELEEFAEHYKEMPVFERKETKVENPKSVFPEENKIDPEKSKSLNDRLNQGLNIGLNNRLAFIKHLFNEEEEVYKRVLSQINTMSTFEEVEIFIKGKVKPDYNNWLNKEEYSDRFMAIIRKSFN